MNDKTKKNKKQSPKSGSRRPGLIGERSGDRPARGMAKYIARKSSYFAVDMIRAAVAHVVSLMDTERYDVEVSYSSPIYDSTGRGRLRIGSAHECVGWIAFDVPVRYRDTASGEARMAIVVVLDASEPDVVSVCGLDLSKEDGGYVRFREFSLAELTYDLLCTSLRDLVDSSTSY